MVLEAQTESQPTDVIFLPLTRAWGGEGYDKVSGGGRFVTRAGHARISEVWHTSVASVESRYVRDPFFKSGSYRIRKQGACSFKRFTTVAKSELKPELLIYNSIIYH